MKKIIGDFSTEVKLSAEEAKSICQLGKKEKCCAFLTATLKGFECARMSHPINTVIFSRLRAGNINAKGEGGWKGCAWEGEI